MYDDIIFNLIANERHEPNWYMCKLDWDLLKWSRRVYACFCFFKLSHDNWLNVCGGILEHSGLHKRKNQMY